ncbi:peptidoglycan-binding domain-containing protein [Roseovarius sp. Pro17]|uniref:peptidoglycan-binding domain-containing protein n=1 Tax=Roseovarius sp. Pro17 TaxID=3108175 RepID=UPI002D79A1C6|nr:peptidoglycan-binding domain-containing protein [Roseovarius sp. Pro17]
MTSRTLPLLAILMLVACDTSVTGTGGPGLLQTLANAPAGAAPGTCWGKLVTPAVIETVTNQILVQSSERQANGSVATPAIYKTDTRQAIVQERDVTWFETPCPTDLTPDFVASLQRALKARTLYHGAISGQMDTRTRAAVRKFQQPEGLNSGILSLAAARTLGLVAVELDGT